MMQDTGCRVACGTAVQPTSIASAGCATKSNEGYISRARLVGDKVQLKVGMGAVMAWRYGGQQRGRESAYLS